MHSNRFSSLLMLLWLGAAACSTPPLPEEHAKASTLSPDLRWDELTLGPNDIVRVGVFGHPELSTPLSGTLSGAVGSRVDGAGGLSLPLVGTVAIGGMSLEEAREKIRAAYAAFVQEPKVDVSVVEYAARRFYLYGEVNQPGAYTIDRPLNLYQALTYGKGLSPRADRSEVVLLRGKPEALEVHVFNANSPTAKGLNALRPDDMIFVRRSGAGRFSDEFLPILVGISNALGSVATILLIDDQLGN